MVGIRRLKAQLSAYVARARAGERVIITDRGEEVAELVPLSPERRAIKKLLADGKMRWSGAKPAGLAGVTVRGGSVSETVREDRR